MIEVPGIAQFVPAQALHQARCKRRIEFAVGQLGNLLAVTLTL